jgi:type II secretion system protein N
MLSRNRKLLLAIAGYVLFFGLCFVTSAYYTFPYERVRDLLMRRVAAQPVAAGEGPAKLTIAELGPHGLAGIALEGVEYERKAAVATDPPIKLVVDELSVGASLFGLLTKRIDVSFGMTVGEGEADGEYETKEGEPTRLQAELDAIDLGRLGVGSYLGIPIKGKATGTIDVTLADKPAGTQGNIELRIEDLELGDGKAKLKLPGMPGGLTVDTINAGDLDLKVVIRDGIASFEKLESKGKDLELNGSGSVRVVKPVAQSRADLTLGVKVEDGYKKKSERTAAAFELLSNSPLMKRAMSADGMIRFRLTGPITAMRAAPGAGAGGSARARKAKKDAPEPSLP